MIWMESDKHQAFFVTALQPFVGGKSVELALDVKHGIDAPDCLQRHRRDRRSILSAFGVGGDVGKPEEFAPRMGPAKLQ
ncbi:hypothetical protein ATY30_28305 [Sinorhizobium americanum]|nr:hypothetical protein ATY30_28305 [Sinorhizobium americanum]